jgi:hypothetical protein
MNYTRGCLASRNIYYSWKNVALKEFKYALESRQKTPAIARLLSAQLYHMTAKIVE